VRKKLFLLVAGLTLSIPLLSYAQFVLDDFVKEEMIATMDATVSKDIVFERLQIYDDVQYFTDTERGNLCYIYRESSISCVKI